MADTAGGEVSPLGHAGAAPTRPLLDRLWSFRITYIAIFVFLLLYVVTVEATENLLERHFQSVVADAVEITNFDVPITLQIQSKIERRVMDTIWVRYGGIRVSAMVLGKDGRTWLYVGGRVLPPPDGLDPTDVLREAVRQLPATGEVVVSVPHNAVLSNVILIAYAGVLLQGLFFYYRAVARRESRTLAGALAVRDEAAQRAARIERELGEVREQLLSMEPSNHEQSDEIRALQQERESLHAKLAELARREEELRGSADKALELDQERQALEDLLEEAADDLTTKGQEIQRLEKSLKRASRDASGRRREVDATARRLRLLYKNLEIEDRAIDDFVALRDETMKLKAEESLKRLSDDADNVAVRRKVGGLPSPLSIFELGFAGKGRIYYCKGRQRRFRVLTVGAKNTQATDMEYLRRLAREDHA